MALTFTLDNIMKFFTYISPIFISSFLLIQSAMDWNLKGLVYLFGICLTYIFGILLKTMFWQLDGRRIGGKWSRKPFRINTPAMPGHTSLAMPDYCTVFEGPFHNSTLSAIATPSLNAMFHFFTLIYITLAVGTNPYKPPGGIAFVILLGITAITNLSFRYILMCDDFKSIAIGGVFGLILGGLWFAIIKATRPDWLFYGDEKQSKKCKLGPTKFKCTYE
tara:strand:- start:145 stop:804 length:660 start_codon:yes stop_codon:yes gene_type:complete